MKPLWIIILIIAFNTSAQAEDKQLFGSHAFLSLPRSYVYSHDILGYISEDRKVMLTSSRIRGHASLVRQQLEESGFTPVVSGPDRKIYLSKLIRNGAEASLYAMHIGNNRESAMISAVSSSEAETAHNDILNILKTAKWKEHSGLNFERSFFFKIDNLYEFSPATIIGPFIAFTPYGEPLEQSKMSLKIGKFPLPYDYRGKEMEILDRYSNSGREPSKIKTQEYNTININGVNGVTLFRKYENNGEEINGKLTILFRQGSIVVIEAESSSREMDKYLNNYENILNGFKIKDNI